MVSKRTTRTRYTHVDRVEVFVWGKLIGAVALDPGYGFYAFRYTPEFQARGIELSPLMMPVSRDETFLFPDLPELTYKRLPAMLADALPDDFGNALIDRWMLDHGISREAITPLDRLAYMSTRAMGALTFKPARGPGTKTAISIHLSELVGAARAAVHGDFGDEVQVNAALRNIIEVGTSAGGARAKAVIAWNPTTQEIRSGHAEAPPGFEHWLLKFDGIGRDHELGTSQDHGRIEYAYHLMATAAGIQMSECRLLKENGRAHFITRRFDREGTERHHVQSLCAMSHLDYKKRGANSYRQLFETMHRLELPYEQREEAYRRMVFNVMARNCDDHTKNFAFRLRRDQPWELAPAYDVTFAHNPKGEWTHQHLMSVNGKYKDFTEEDLLQEGEVLGIGTAPSVIERVRAAVSQWSSFAATAEVSTAEQERIQSYLLPLDAVSRRETTVSMPIAKEAATEKQRNLKARIDARYNELESEKEHQSTTKKRR